MFKVLCTAGLFDSWMYYYLFIYLYVFLVMMRYECVLLLCLSTSRCLLYALVPEDVDQQSVSPPTAAHLVYLITGLSLSSSLLCSYYLLLSC